MGSQVASDMTDTVTEGRGLVQMVTEPSPTPARWFVGLGAWGLLLAVLNLMGMAHPTQRISWAGVLSMGRTSGAFEAKATAPAFVGSDAVFILLCGVVLALGLRSIAEEEGGLPGFFRSMISNDTWKALSSTKNGAALTLGAWSLLIGFLFYAVWGIRYMTWFDPGVYAVSAVFIAFGFALRYLSMADADGRAAAAAARAAAAPVSTPTSGPSRAEQKAARRAAAKAKAEAEAEENKAKAVAKAEAAAKKKAEEEAAAEEEAKAAAAAEEEAKAAAAAEEEAKAAAAAEEEAKAAAAAEEEAKAAAAAEEEAAAAPESDTKESKRQEELKRVKERAKTIDFEVLGTATAAEKDDLQAIKGIGPFIEEKLNALGIFTFRQLSNMNDELEEEVNVAIEFFPGRVKRDEWAKQARDLVNGE